MGRRSNFDVEKHNREVRKRRRELANNPQELIKATSFKIGCGCWQWVGNISKRGYGKVYFKGKVLQAHRLSYLAFNGDFDQSLFVCHKCDNPICVNPSHLFLGTCKDNTHDSIEKGRFYQKYEVGHKPVNRLITDELAKEIREAIVNKPQAVSLKQLAEKFNVPYNLVKDIKRGRSYSGAT